MIVTRSSLRSWLLTIKPTPFGLYKFFSCKATLGTKVFDYFAEARTSKILCNLSIRKPGHPRAGLVEAHSEAAGRDRARWDADRTVRPETSVLCTFQGIVDMSSEHLSKSTNERNPM